MGECCSQVTKQEKQQDELVKGPARNVKERSELNRNSKYYGGYKNNLDKMVTKKEEQIVERQSQISMLQQKKSQLKEMNDPSKEIAILKLQRKIDTHQKIIQQTKDQIKKIQERA